MKTRNFIAAILSLSLAATLTASAYELGKNEREISADECESEPQLQTSYDRTGLTPAQEHEIIERWLEEYPDAIIGTSNGMLVLDIDPWADCPAAETSAAEEQEDEQEEQEQPSETPKTETDELFANVTSDEIDAYIYEHLVLDAEGGQTSYDRSELTNEEEHAIIEQWLQKYPNAIIGTSCGHLVLDTQSWSECPTGGASINIPNLDISDYTTEPNIASPYTIIGSDNRRHCLTTSVAPYSFTAYIVSKYKTGNNTYDYHYGTAFFVDKDLLLTAAHCIYDQSLGYAEKIYIFPGGCESGISYSVSYTAYASNKWLSNSNDRSGHDYGVIKVLADISSGYYQLSEKTDSQLTGKNITLYGFPNDKPYNGTSPVSDISHFYEFWISTGTVNTDAEAIKELYFLHTADTQSVNSGSPIFLSNGIGTVVGINTGHLESENYNFAIRITPSIIQFVNKYK